MSSPLVSLFLGEALLREQIEIILKCQQSTLFSASLASGVSLLGSGKVILFVLCVLLWLGDQELGWKPSNAATHMLIACGLAKAFLKGPRPYFIDSRVKTLDPTREESYGFPSGHTSGVVSIYGLIAAYYCDNQNFFSLGWFLYACICAVVAFSRVYTGAHFVTDVIAGFFLGALLLWNELQNNGKLSLSPFQGLESSLGSFPGSHHISEAIYCFSISALCFSGMWFASTWNRRHSQEESEPRIDFKLNQEGLCGAGFAFGLGLCHLLEFGVSQTLSTSTYRPLPWFGCVVGFLGIAAIDISRKMVLGSEKELSLRKTIQVTSFYSLIMVWALWMTPALFSPYSHMGWREFLKVSGR